jgi:hypothetical protein
MKKSDLRQALSQVSYGSMLRVVFKKSSQLQANSGLYMVRSVRRGRGKGGSLLADLRSANESSTVLTVGTGDSDSVLSVVHEDAARGSTLAFYGDRDDALEPVKYTDERNAQKASELKEAFRQVLDTGIHGRFHEVVVSSREQALDGRFVVKSAKQYRGRVGQIVLRLESVQGGDEVLLCSYSHSALIDSLSVERSALR